MFCSQRVIQFMRALRTAKTKTCITFSFLSIVVSKVYLLQEKAINAKGNENQINDNECHKTFSIFLIHVCAYYCYLFSLIRAWFCDNRDSLVVSVSSWPKILKIRCLCYYTYICVTFNKILNNKIYIIYFH